MVSGHDQISAEKSRRNRGRKIRFSGDFAAHLEGSPGDWTLDDLGRPCWLTGIRDAVSGRWTEIARPADAHASALPPSLVELLPENLRAAMPSVGPRMAARLHPPEPPRGRGRPPVPSSAPTESRWCAWLVDIRDCSQLELARRLAVQQTRSAEPTQRVADAAGLTRAMRRYAELRIQAGRLLLHRDGALPWILWPDGAVPLNWWTSRWFFGGLKAWYDVLVPGGG